MLYESAPAVLFRNVLLVSRWAASCLKNCWRKFIKMLCLCQQMEILAHTGMTASHSYIRDTFHHIHTTSALLDWDLVPVETI